MIACLAHNLLPWTTVLGLPATTVRVARTLRRRLLDMPVRLTRTARRWTLHLQAAGPGRTTSTPRSSASGRSPRPPDRAARPSPEGPAPDPGEPGAMTAAPQSAPSAPPDTGAPNHRAHHAHHAHRDAPTTADPPPTPRRQVESPQSAPPHPPIIGFRAQIRLDFLRSKRNAPLSRTEIERPDMARCSLAPSGASLGATTVGDLGLRNEYGRGRLGESLVVMGICGRFAKPLVKS